MAAPKGNQFWKARTKHGRKKLFAGPDVLWEACCKYFEWVEDNPLYEMKSYQYQGTTIQDKLEKMRAMTIGGLCLFLDIGHRTWNRWREDEDLCQVITRVEQVIYTQKFAGAAAGLLNANIIARDLELRDASSHEHTGPNGGPIEHRMTPARAREVLERHGILPGGTNARG